MRLEDEWSLGRQFVVVRQIDTLPRLGRDLVDLLVEDGQSAQGERALAFWVVRRGRHRMQTVRPPLDQLTDSGVADPLSTVARDCCSSRHAAARQAMAGCVRRTATKLSAATKHSTAASRKAGSYVPSMSRLTPVPKAITPAAT